MATTNEDFQKLVEQYEKVINSLDEALGQNNVEKFQEIMEGLSDVELETMIGDISFYDNESRTIVFKNEAIAIAYASEIQRKDKLNRFSEINLCYSNLIPEGLFYLAEPMGTHFSAKNKEWFDFNSIDDFLIIDFIRIYAIYEKQFRQKNIKNKKRKDIKTEGTMFNNNPNSTVSSTSLNPNNEPELQEKIEKILKKFANAEDDKDIMRVFVKLSDSEVDLLIGDDFEYLNEPDNKIKVFLSEFEATAYASEMQRRNPKIRFFRLHKHFSINMPMDGYFWIIEPMETDRSKSENFDLNSNDDFTYANPYSAFAIYEKRRRERASEE